MRFTSQWQIADTISNFVGSVDAFREEVYALEGDPFPSWWAGRNPELAAQRTSLHEFVWALRLVGELDFRFRHNSRLLARLSVATYPHVPEVVPIEQLLCALSSGSAVDLYPYISAITAGLQDPFSNEKPVGPVWLALNTLFGLEHARNRRVETDCYCISFSADVSKVRDEYSPRHETEPVNDILADGPFDRERVEQPGPLSLPEFFDSTHWAETRFEPCPCISEPKPEYPEPFDAHEPEFVELTIDHANTLNDESELVRILQSKGVNRREVETFLSEVSSGDVLAIEDGTWVSSTNHDRRLVDSDGFTFRIEPSPEDGFDEQITLRFRKGDVRAFVRFTLPSGIEDRMSWGQELERALPALTEFAAASGSSGADERVGVRVRLDYQSFSGDSSITVFGGSAGETQRYGPYQSLADAAVSASRIAQRPA